MDWLQLYKSDTENECRQPRLLLSVDLQILPIFDEQTVTNLTVDGLVLGSLELEYRSIFPISALPTLTNFCNTLN